MTTRSLFLDFMSKAWHIKTHSVPRNSREPWPLLEKRSDFPQSTRPGNLPRPDRLATIIYTSLCADRKATAGAQNFAHPRFTDKRTWKTVLKQKTLPESDSRQRYISTILQKQNSWHTRTFRRRSTAPFSSSTRTEVDASTSISIAPKIEALRQ